MDVGQLREQLATIEHERWASWQRYVHSLCIRLTEDIQGTEGEHVAAGSLIIQPDRVQHWERQIATPYAGLSEHERAMDMEQVDKYWPLIKDAAELAEYLWYEGTSAKEVLEQLRAGTHEVAHKDDVTHEDRMGNER